MSPLEKIPSPGVYPLTVAKTATTALAKVSASEIVGSAAERKGLLGLEIADDVTMVCCPDLMALYQAGMVNMDEVKVGPDVHDCSL